MIHRAIQLIQIFLAHGRTKVFQEVLADLKTGEMVRGAVPKGAQQESSMMSKLNITKQIKQLNVMVS